MPQFLAAHLNDRDARQDDSSTRTWPRVVPRWLEWLAIASLVLLACHFLNISWRKWPDPQIDFGRELYLPWRLSLGDVLGRDIEPQFGPLSQYFNAGLFALFGPSLIVLVSANLAIYGAILFSAYWILREGWGVIGAWAGSVVLVSVFSFSQFDIIGNYNYATPYAHEATHGLLVCLVLSGVLISFLRQPALWKCALAGFLFGLSAVLKAEIILAAAAAVAATAILYRNQWTWRAALRMGLVFLIAAMLPTVAFIVYLSRHLSADAAFLCAGRAWLNVVATTRFIDELAQQQFLGFDEPWRNLADHAFATGIGATIVALIVLAARVVERLGLLAGPPGGRHLAFALGMAAIGAVTGQYIPWPLVGQALLGMAILGLLINLLPYGSRRDREQASALGPARAARIVAGTLAIVLMARMLLNGRIQHYGFVQAALAAMVVVAAMAAEWPARFGVTRCGRIATSGGMMALIASGIIGLIPISARLLDAKRLAVGSGPDLFYAFPARISPVGELVRASSEYLSRTDLGDKILVLPEGVMINYLSRRATPTATYRFFASDLAEGREERMVDEMKKHPPTWIVLLSRDLREFGIARYGDKKGEGQAFLQWIANDYQLAARAGGDPLNPRQAGLAIYRPRSRSEGDR